MMNINTLLMTDFYKTCHMNMYSDKIAKMTSYLTPRSSRIPGLGWVVFMGLTDFCQTYLIEGMNNTFFNVDFEIIKEQYYDVLWKSLRYPKKDIDKTVEKVKALHELRYLPIQIKAVPEGTRVPMGCPCVEISVTDGRFPWVGQAIECLLSANIWHPMVSATVATLYRQIADAYAIRTSDKPDGTHTMCDFSLRGQESMESAIRSSVSWLTAFKNSSTVPAKASILNSYCDEDIDIFGLTSTEHSVMTTDYAINGGDERETYRRLLTEVYPETSFAAVCDSYDFWNVLTNILPSLKEEINNHKGFIGVRHDSAEPVRALCGLQVVNGDLDDFQFNKKYLTFADIRDILNEKYFIKNIYDSNFFLIVNEVTMTLEGDFIKTGRKRYFKVNAAYDDTKDEFSEWEVFDYEERKSYEDRTWEEKGMVETICELFGYTVNSKGYKVCNPHLKAVYGDSITLTRANRIFKLLEQKGYSIDNVSLGVGSFSMEAMEINGKLYPFTRDTFSIAIKCTWCELTDGTRMFVYKDPKNFSGKKSQKGLCQVDMTKYGQLVYTDEILNPEDMDEHLSIDKNNTTKNIMEDYFVPNTSILSYFNNIRNTVNKNIKRDMEIHFETPHGIIEAFKILDDFDETTWMF